MLLEADEPCAAIGLNETGRSPFLIACDHAGRRIPRQLGTLGLPKSELDRHIAWDIGVEPVSRLVATALDASVVQQVYSRLVIDCNRPLHVESSIPQISERTVIPGNIGLTDPERRARIAEIFTPYHDCIARQLDRRAAEGRPTILVCLHTFTPSYLSEARPWHVGLLYRDDRLAKILLKLLREDPDLVVGDNQPYDISDSSDYTIPRHGEARGIPHVGIEIRQDLVFDEQGQSRWAALVARLLAASLQPLRSAASG